jgi:subtilisin family serine protease
MAKWILKANSIDDTEKIANAISEYESDDVSVKDVLTELGMIIFFAPDDDAELISKNPKISFVVKDSERKLSDFPINEYEDDDTESVNVSYSAIQNTTIVGEFNGNTECYSHLEILSSRTFNQSSNFIYDPTKTGKQVDCYIIDTGVNFNHPYLKGRVHRVPGFTLNLDNKQDGDDNGHGTYSALFSSGKNCGVAQDSKVYALKVMDKRGSGYNSEIAMAINAVVVHHKQKVEYAKNNNTQTPSSVLNFSIGMMPSASYPSFTKDTTGGDYITLDAMKTAAYNGVHVSAAAGNGFFKSGSLHGPMMSTLTNGQMNLSQEESENNDPGQGLPVVVGATSGNSIKYDGDPHKMAPFSNYGKGNTINAPGEKLIIPSWTWQHTEGDTYAWKSGTSFSTPITAGLIALYLEHDRELTPLDVKNKLKQDATKNAIDNLMKPIELKNNGHVLFRFNNDIVQIKYPDGENLKSSSGRWKKIQVTGIDNDDLLYFDDWYDTKWMSDTKLAFYLGNPSDFAMKISGDNIVVSNLDNTHESTDGIKRWQNEDHDNLLIKYEGNTESEYHYIGAVEYTDNLITFNPFQEYIVEWDNIGTIKYDESGIIGQKPIAIIKTLRGDVPYDTNLSWEGTSLPCDIGVVGVEQANSIQDGSAFSGTLHATNGYESFSAPIKFEYAGNTQSVDNDVNLFLSNKSGLISIQNGIEFESTHAYFIVTDTDVGKEFTVDVVSLDDNLEETTKNQKLLKTATINNKYYYTVGRHMLKKISF